MRRSPRARAVGGLEQGRILGQLRRGVQGLQHLPHGNGRCERVLGRPAQLDEELRLGVGVSQLVGQHQRQGCFANPAHAAYPEDGGGVLCLHPGAQLGQFRLPPGEVGGGVGSWWRAWMPSGGVW